MNQNNKYNKRLTRIIKSWTKPTIIVSFLMLVIVKTNCTAPSCIHIHFVVIVHRGPPSLHIVPLKAAAFNSHRLLFKYSNWDESLYPRLLVSLIGQKVSQCFFFFFYFLSFLSLLLLALINIYYCVLSFLHSFLSFFLSS